jgi:hypothetical protein
MIVEARATFRLVPARVGTRQLAAFLISSQTLTQALSRSAFISAKGLSGGITA